MTMTRQAITCRSRALAVVAGMALLAAPAAADEIDLADYLASVDHASVQFTGHILYNSTERTFTFYNAERRAFGATVDAGRDVRERIERDCENSGFMVRIDDLCAISGDGTVEIDGSSIRISIDRVDQLTPREN